MSEPKYDPDMLHAEKRFAEADSPEGRAAAPTPFIAWKRSSSAWRIVRDQRAGLHFCARSYASPALDVCVCGLMLDAAASSDLLDAPGHRDASTGEVVTVFLSDAGFDGFTVVCQDCGRRSDVEHRREADAMVRRHRAGRHE